MLILLFYNCMGDLFVVCYEIVFGLIIIIKLCFCKSIINLLNSVFMNYKID